jgi:hypothetical protein
MEENSPIEDLNEKVIDFVNPDKKKEEKDV